MYDDSTMNLSRALFAVVSASTLLVVAPWACSSDPAPGSPTGQGGNANGPGSGGSAGPGGGQDPNACGADCPLQCNASLVSPSNGSCVQIGGPIACNPISNEGCNSIAGEVCDWGPSGFECYGGDNLQEMCQECSPQGKHCHSGLTCVGDYGACAKFCCNDQDCEPGGTCVIAVLDVGVCQGGSATTTTGTGGGGPASSSSSVGVGGMGGMMNGVGGMLNGAGGMGGLGGLGGN